MQLNDPPLLSVILPVYNAEKYVTQAIESILGQTFTDFELLIADDGSKDNSAFIIDQFAREDPRIVVSHNETNQGKTRTVNRLFKMCEGHYVTVHDADDYSEKTRFEEQIKILKNNPSIALCACDFLIIDSKSKLVPVQNERNLSYHGPTIIFKKSIVPELGGLYRDIFLVSEDIDFIKRVKELHPTKYCDLPLYYYRWDSKSITKNINGYTPERYAIYDLLDFLENERALSGKDSLMLGKQDYVNTKYKKMVADWYLRQDEILVDGINRSIYFGLFINALRLSVKYILYRPFNITPYKYFISATYRALKSLVL